MADGGRVPVPRVLLLLPAGFALMAGLNAALILLGLPAPVRGERFADVHGVLLVLGFVGTLIALERAVALGRRWGYFAPAVLGAGGLLLVSPLPIAAGGWLLALGSALLVAVYVPLWRRQPAVAVTIQAGGAVLAVGAALLWVAGVPTPWVVPWLAGFLVLTIAGERIELARVGRMDQRAELVATLLAATVTAGVVASLLWPEAGSALLGGALLGFVGWLVGFDVARRTIRSSGLPRFMAGCLLAGYGWLAVAGVIWLVTGPQFSGAGYDAVVHAVFLGFVLSMIMAHAPVILPAILRRPLPYHPVMLVPAILLHASLLIRIVGGDARGIGWAWQGGGLLNIVAVLGFVAVAVWSVATLTRQRTRVTPKVTEPAATAAKEPASAAMEPATGVSR